MKILKKYNSSDLIFVEPVLYPDKIKNELSEVMTASTTDMGINKFLFKGLYGTGKHTAIKIISSTLCREIYYVCDKKIIKNPEKVSEIFDEIRKLNNKKIIILFDYTQNCDSIYENPDDYVNSLTKISAEMENIDKEVMLVVIIDNSYFPKILDKYFMPKFDRIIDFNNYSREDLVAVGELIVNNYFFESRISRNEMKLLKKILSKCNRLPLPADLKRIIKTSIACCGGDEIMCLRNIYKLLYDDQYVDYKELHKAGYSLREIEKLTGISRSKLCRDLKVQENEIK